MTTIIVMIIFVVFVFAAIMVAAATEDAYRRSKSKVSNPVTRCGEGLRPFVEACGNGKIEKMAKELLAKADEKTATTTLDGGDEIYVNYAFYNARAISAACGIEVPPPPAIYFTDKDGNIVPNPNPPPIER